MGGESSGRSDGQELRPFDAQSDRPYRSVRHDPGAGDADIRQFSFRLRLRQTGAGEFLQSAQSQARHGVGSSGRADDEFDIGAGFRDHLATIPAAKPGGFGGGRHS